jgi:protein-disulfide isomerase
MTQPTPPSQVPAGATPEGDGILIGSGPVRVDAYIDFLCPFCRQFELAAESTLAKLVADQQISLACAADQGKFLPYAHELFVRQPPEGGAGLSDAELADIGDAVGLTGTAFADCLAKAPYRDWPSYVTERAVDAGVGGTPTVLVAGASVDPEARAIAAAVAAASGTS